MVDFIKAIKMPLDNTKILIAPFVIYFAIFIISAIGGGIIDVAKWAVVLFPTTIGAIALISIGITALVGIVVLVLTLIVSGYLLNIFEKIINKKTLPNFQLSSALDYVIRSVKAGIISFIYMLPGSICILIAISILFGGAIIGLISGGNTEAIIKAAMTNILTAGLISIPFVLLGLLFLIVAVYFLPAALAIWFKEGKMLAAFSFGRILKNVLKLDYFLSLIIAFCINLLIGMIVGVIMFIVILVVSILFPNVGNAMSIFVSNIISFIIGMMLYAMLAEVIE